MRMTHLSGLKYMKSKMIKAHLDVAARYSELSHAVRLKVGAIVVKDDRIISIGYNGTPAGWDNVCEEKVYSIGNPNDFSLKTKTEVLHAEENAIAKLAKSNESGLGADIFITHAPCPQCAKLIYAAGISRVFYRHIYRDAAGIEFLQKCGVTVIQVPDEK